MSETINPNTHSSEHTPPAEKIHLEDADGNTEEWEVSHTDADSGMVYLKHYYGEASDNTFLYRGVSSKLFQELTGVTPEDPGSSTASTEAPSHTDAAHASETERPVGLPKTFGEIRTMPGHSIEDFLATLPDVGNEAAKRATTPDYNGKNDKDQLFWADPANIEKYDQEMIKLTGELIRENPHQKTHSVTRSTPGWRYHDSKMLVHDKVEKASTDEATASIYLNPPMENMAAIYRQIFEKAEAEGLRFQARVFDPDLSGKSQGHGENRLEAAQKWAKNPSYRTDHMVFYGFPESTEKLYTIVKEAYESNSDVFAGRELGFGPYKVAPGFGVGEGLSKAPGRQVHSKILAYSIAAVEKTKVWSVGNTPAERKQIFAKVFRDMLSNARAGKVIINPDNIAFR